MASLDSVNAFKSASEVAVRGCSKIPVLLFKPDGARYLPVLGRDVLGEATPGRENCEIWYGRTSQDQERRVLYDLAGARDFVVEVEKGCDGKELIGDTEGIILHYIVHSVKRAIREALYNIDTMHDDQTLKCIFHIKKTPLYHFALEGGRYGAIGDL